MDQRPPLLLPPRHWRPRLRCGSAGATVGRAAQATRRSRRSVCTREDQVWSTASRCSSTLGTIRRRRLRSASVGSAMGSSQVGTGAESPRAGALDFGRATPETSVGDRVSAGLRGRRKVGNTSGPPRRFQDEVERCLGRRRGHQHPPTARAPASRDTNCWRVHGTTAATTDRLPPLATGEHLTGAPQEQKSCVTVIMAASRIIAPSA